MQRDGFQPAQPEDPLRGLLVPDILHAEDVKAIFRFQSISGARAAITAGRFGPYTRIGRRLVLRRESVLAHLAAEEEDPARDRGPRELPRRTESSGEGGP